MHFSIYCATVCPCSRLAIRATAKSQQCSSVWHYECDYFVRLCMRLVLVEFYSVAPPLRSTKKSTPSLRGKNQTE